VGVAAAETRPFPTPPIDGVNMSVSTPSQPQLASTVPTLTEDPFAQTVIRRCVGRLLRCPEFAPHEAEDLQQELQAELDRAMRRPTA
jgi:hypothetical protein